jgi:hypothetical protein
MLTVDPFVIDYLGWMMPVHVLAGVLAALALLLTVVSREPVFRLRRLRANRHVHVWSAIATTGLTGWHVLASSAKLTAAWQPALIAAPFLLLLVPAAVTALRRAGWWRRRRASHRGLVGAARPRVARAGTADIFYLLALLGGIAALLTAVPQLLTIWAPVEP